MLCLDWDMETLTDRQYSIADKLHDELKIAMKYNNDLYIEEVIKIVLDFSCPGRVYNEEYYENKSRKPKLKYELTNQILYDALVKYNKIKGLHDNART